jgi:hypothetical protein
MRPGFLLAQEKDTGYFPDSLLIPKEIFGLRAGRLYTRFVLQPARFISAVQGTPPESASEC